MENVKSYVEAKIKETEHQLEQMSVGIDARKALAGKYSDRICNIKKCKQVIEQAGLPTDLIDDMHHEVSDSFKENEEILKNLKTFRSNARMDLTVLKKALEKLNEN